MKPKSFTIAKILNRLSFFLLFVLTFSSCSPLKFWDKAVFKHYGEFPALKPVTPNSPLLVNIPLAEKDSSKAYVTGNGEVKKNLFLLLYWKHHSAFNVKLNDKIPLHQFSNSLYQYAKSKQVADKLKGDQLVIVIEKWPHSFSYNFEQTAYLLFFRFDKFYLKPMLQNVLVSYKINREGAIIKEGTVEITDPTRIYGVGMFKTVNAAANDYLTSYDAFYKGLGKQVIDKILAAQ